MGGIINLILGGIPGALFFSLGLITIVTFGYELFTGKAGLLSSKEIKPKDLIRIWLGNFIGACCCAAIVACTPIGLNISERAMEIVALRNSQPAIINCIYGIYCGMLMYIAVTGYKKTQNYLFTILPVAFFILCGYNHCVADMFYISLGATELSDFWSLIPTTIGNIIGCNIIPQAQRLQYGV